MYTYSSVLEDINKDKRAQTLHLFSSEVNFTMGNVSTREDSSQPRLFYYTSMKSYLDK